MYPHKIIPLRQHVTVTGARILAKPRIVTIIILYCYFKYFEETNLNQKSKPKRKERTIVFYLLSKLFMWV